MSILKISNRSFLDQNYNYLKYILYAKNSNYTVSNGDQYLQKSILPTDFFQSSLPRLPIPKLEKTCERYLNSLEPLINDKEQFKNTKKNINNFQNGIGKILNEKLIKINKINKHTSYICKPWFEMYLKSRLPLVLNYNPFMSWKDDRKAELNIRPVRVTNFIISALRFRRSLLENLLEPEVFHLNPKKSDTLKYRQIIKYMPKSIAFYPSALFYKAYPLDMSQFKNLFSSTRIPKENIDEIKLFDNSKHIVLIRKGEIFSLDVLGENDNFKSPDFIYTCIKHICNRKIESKGNHATIFTAEDRNKWAKIREKLFLLDEKNKKNIEIIDSALFVICLDDVEFDQDLIKHSHNFLHGNALQNLKTKPVLNRWFDKSFSIIFTKDGHASINFEHSWGDGVAVLRFFNEVYFDSSKQFVSPSTVENKSCNAYEEIKNLDFVFDDEIKNAANEANKKYNKFTSNLDLNYTINKDMNRDYFKKNKLSPDSMFQLSFQLGYYRIFNHTTATYESCSTSAFKHGRTETVRSCTNETKIFCEKFLTKKNLLTKNDLRKLLDDCSKKHSELTKNAAMGQGFDRHLFGLKNIFINENGEKADLPEIYTDPSFIFANNFELSTSTLYGESFSGGGFAPVVNDGFGIGYGYVDENLGILLSSYKDKRNGKELVNAIEESLKDINSILN